MTTKVTKEQLAFARSMTPKQWHALRGLYTTPCYLSASERGDPETYALIRNKLAQCFSIVPGVWAMFGWRLTEAGNSIMRRRIKGTI